MQTKAFKWIVAVTGTIAALAPLAQAVPGRVGAVAAVIGVIALNINHSLVQPPEPAK
jgi:hypothetical protein